MTCLNCDKRDLPSVRSSTAWHSVSPAHVLRHLRADGFPGFRGRRRATPPGEQARDGSEVPAVADVAALDLSPERVVLTQAAGLFLFMPDLLALNVDQAIARAGYPGSKMIPPIQAILAVLAGKLVRATPEILRQRPIPTQHPREGGRLTPARMGPSGRGAQSPERYPEAARP